MNGFEVEGETWSERERDTMERTNANGGKKGPTQWPRAPAPAGGRGQAAAREGGEALF